MKPLTALVADLLLSNRSRDSRLCVRVSGTVWACLPGVWGTKPRKQHSKQEFTQFYLLHFDIIVGGA